MSAEIVVQPTWWQNALPEAIGGAAVAIVVFAAEWIREAIVASKRHAKARFAALSQLRTIRTSAEQISEAASFPSDVPFLHSAAFGSLVQVVMEGLGKPDHEAALAAICEEVERFNALSLRLLIETSGVGRAMGDHAPTTDALWQSLQGCARRIVEVSDGFRRLLQR